MRIHALYTPSHSRIVEEHFRPTAAKFFGAGSVDCRLAQGAPEGTYGTPGFVSYCQQRVRRYAETCEAGDEPIVLSDVDVRFYGDVPADLQRYSSKHDHDAYFQWDGKGGHCMGFVFVRRRGPFAALMRQVGELVLADASLDDQKALKQLVREGRVKASLGVLPTWKYWTSGLGAHTWLPGEPLSPPAETLLMHHGNWTYGVPNKLALLAAVEGLVAARGRAAPAPPAPGEDRELPRSLKPQIRVNIEDEGSET